MSKVRRVDLVFYVLTVILIAASVICYALGRGIAFWKAVTFLGEDYFYVILLPLIYLILDREFGFRLILVFLTSMWVNAGLKGFLKLPRPPKSRWLVEASGYGFPSGHAQGSTTFYGYIASEYKSVGFIVFSVILIGFICASRIILGVHYLRDIIGGVVIGLVIVLLSYFLEGVLYAYKAHVRLCLLATLILAEIVTGFILKSYIIFLISGLCLGVYVGHRYSAKREYPRRIALRVPLAAFILFLVVLLHVLFKKTVSVFYLFFPCYFIVGLVVTVLPVLIYSAFRRA